MSGALGFLAATVGLALGGFDPAPALIASIFLGTHSGGSGDAAGRDDARARSAVLAFGAALIGGTAAWGILLTALFGPALSSVHWLHLLRLGAWAAGIEATAAVAVLAWAWWAWRRRARPREERRRPVRGPAGLMLVAVGFVAIVTTDVPFIVQIAMGSEQPGWLMVVGHVLWAAVSQLPLLVLCVAVAVGRHHAAARAVGKVWERVRPVTARVLPLAGAAVGLLMLADAADFFVTGQFLINPTP